MSWAEEDWTVGLSGQVLQKVKELQIHQERLSRESKQKQLQLDKVQTSLEKQTVKYEEVRGELQSVQRELQSVRDEAKAAVISRERLVQELQTKQAQVCSFEGQLDSARSLNNKLTQEVKRLEAELEKLQNSSRAADTTLFSTPCWNTTSPWEHNESRKEEEKPWHRDEAQSTALHIRRLQFSDNSLPRQQHKSTPHHHLSDQSESFSTPSAAFPWERDDSRPKTRRPSPASPQTPSTDVISRGQPAPGLYGKEMELRTETDISVSEIQSRLACLEEELSAKARSLKSIQNDLMQSNKELAARELSLQKAGTELSLARTRMTQEGERASGAEQRLKQLQEELRCQRQNTESSRLQHQQRAKDLEKQHQRDLTELQKERQCLEKQHQQEVNKLNQELQQARTLHNALQAQADKLSLQKQALDKELDTLKEKLKWTEGQLKESQKKEAQTQARLTEAMREAEGAAVSLEQSRKRERGLEEEGRRLAEERADALCLLKELQEQKAAPEPLQTVQFCPVGQSFSPQPSYALHSRPSSYTKRPATTTRAEQRKEEEYVDEKRVEITASYPPDREPGEGIDSEHITDLTDSESLQREGHRRNKEDNLGINEAIECDSSGTKKHSAFNNVLSSFSHSTAGMPTITSLTPPAEKTPPVKPEQVKAYEELQRENAMLRSEMNDVREELQKRLEDLEAQRRAEAEARTRLKQLSRKHASQTVEKEEQEKEWRAQLDSERSEMERLRKTMAALETEMKIRKEERQKTEREEEEEVDNKALEDRESELIELNIQLKKQLAGVKAQLALEQEERNQITNTEKDVKKELSTKLAELKAELEGLKRNRKEEEKRGEEKLSVANSPLTYLTLHDDELNSNIVHCENKLLPSPEQHLLFCQSTNQLNRLVSQGTADLIQEEQTVKVPECSPLSDKRQTGPLASDLEDDRQNNQGGSLSDQREEPSQPQTCESAPADLSKEVTRLQKEKAKETERADQNQIKLEALQSQVTCQTQQLTMAFDKQSQHISGLLAELQEKESALLSQGEELQQCKQELDAFIAEKEVKGVGGEARREERRNEKSEDTIELQSNEEKDSVVTVHTTSSLADAGSTAQREEGQTKTAAETPTLVSSEEDDEALLFGERPGSVDSQTESSHECILSECSQDGATADVVAELLVLRQENQLLKQRIKALTVSDTNSLALQTDRKNREDKQSQNPGNAVLLCLTEHRPVSVQSNITTEGQESLLQNERRRGDEGGDLKREDKGTTGVEEEEMEELSPLQINHLEQQVVALQMKLRALSEETQQQTEELALWRLASQPAPTFDQFQNQDQSSAAGLTDETTHIPPGTESRAPSQESPSNVAVIREDELFLSCSSNKLQGRMLFSRLQHNNLPETKSFHSSKKMATLQEYNQNAAKIDEESEKENQKINLIQRSDTCPPQHKENRDTELIHKSLEKTGQRVTKGPNETKTTECHTGNPVANPNASRTTSEMNTSSDSSEKAIRTEMTSVSSQTEESLYPHAAQTASELHCAYTQTEEEEEEEEEVDSPPISPIPSSLGAESGVKMLFSGSFPIPSDPARLAERIRRNRTQLSAAFDDTEYEPYGLPEVVMKGFADIPSGPSCPYIVRRGLLGTSVLPVPQKDLGQEEETD
ncbi:centromere protein F isoform X2 [Scophthalmus maximus]|uniref:centromere protein F isoform X2 n=1 Tax=Scophthalmus maximus TaxID=52904 RepID=UPI001FA8F97D|nr:centromere protein F isoform X2 [Scophthalmus maximus]